MIVVLFFYVFGKYVGGVSDYIVYSGGVFIGGFVWFGEFFWIFLGII